MCRRRYLKSWDENSFELWRVRHYSSFSLSFGADRVSIHWLPTNVEKFWCPTHGKAQERKLPYGLGYLWNCREAFHRLIARWALIITFHLIKTFDLHIFWGINLHFTAVVRFSNLRVLIVIDCLFLFLSSFPKPSGKLRRLTPSLGCTLAVRLKKNFF